MSLVQSVPAKRNDSLLPSYSPSFSTRTPHLKTTTSTFRCFWQHPPETCWPHLETFSPWFHTFFLNAGNCSICHHSTVTVHGLIALSEASEFAIAVKIRTLLQAA